MLVQSLCNCATSPSPSLSPLIEPHTARTLGKDNNEVNLSLSGNLGIPFSIFHTGEDIESIGDFKSIKYTRGLSDNFDLSVLVEMQNLNILLGLTGLHQWVRQEHHTLSFLLSAGFNKGYNKFTMNHLNRYTEEYDHEQYKTIANDSDHLLGFFISTGPVYSFKPNDKYELAFNIRINHSYSQTIHETFFGNFSERLGTALAEDIRKELAKNWLIRLLNPGLGKPIKPAPKKEYIKKSSVNLLYGSTNISNTWYFTPSFGTTFSLGFLYPFYNITLAEYSLDLLLINLGLNFHTRF